MFVGEQLFGFWGGRFGVPAGDCQRFYAALGRSADAVFPVAFSVDPGLATGVTSGIVEGFRKNDERLTVER
ncbi:MAG TPA: hypothetical protein VIL34_11075 [Actinopolymorphaceae bacterium]